MKSAIAMTAAILIAALLLPATATADEVQDAVTKLRKGGMGSIVIIEFDIKRTDGRGGQEVKLQGTIVGKDGLVLVSGAKQVDPPVGSGNAKPESFKVRFPGDVKKDASFVGKDDELNLALLRINPSDKDEADYPVAGFGMNANLTPGQLLIPLKRLGHADDDLVTFGLFRISTVIPRPGLPTEYQVLGNLRGFEGCPVFALDTSLVGFISAGTQTRGRRGGRSFRIVNGQLVPAGGGSGGSGSPTRVLHTSVIRDFLSDPTKFARRDSWLGLKGLQALTKPLAEAYGIEKPGGLVIGEVAEKSPAEKAGLKAGDVITAFGGEPVETTKDRDIESFRKKIRRGKAGSSHEVVLLRQQGEGGFGEMRLTAAIEEAPLKESEIPEYHDKTFGLKLKPLTRDFLEIARLPLDSKGVRVTGIDRAGWADLAGIRAGDVIQKMVLKPCQNLDQYKAIMAALLKTRDSEVCYNVTRSRKSLFLCVRPDWDTVEKIEK